MIMKCRYYGTLQLHDGTEVVIRDKAAAEKINKEFEWLASESTDRATKHTIRAVQCLFALKLGDHYGWTTDRISKLLKDVAQEAELIVDGETSVDGDLDELKDGYGIDLMEDGMIRVEHVIEDNIYGEDEWRPLAKRIPTENGLYLVTLIDGTVTTALWDNWYFQHDIPGPMDVLAWRPIPEPWEFWRDIMGEELGHKGIKQEAETA